MRTWNELSMAERADVMKLAIDGGVYDLDAIRDGYNKFAEGGDTNPAMTGMMKSKLATAAHYGNPTARRMTNYDTRSYIWPGEYEYDRGVGELRRGNVYVGSYDNLVTPHIQDTGNGLALIDNVWSPDNDQRSYMQSLKFDNENDARYFGEHYKEIAPMMNLYGKGGKIHIKPENRGKFTRLKERTGHSATWFKQHGTPAQKKMATFTLNARKWKHEDGGSLYSGDNHTGNRDNLIVNGAPSSARYNSSEDLYSSKITPFELTITANKPRNNSISRTIPSPRFKGFDNWVSPEGKGNMSFWSSDIRKAILPNNARKLYNTIDPNKPYAPLDAAHDYFFNNDDRKSIIQSVANNGFTDQEKANVFYNASEAALALYLGLGDKDFQTKSGIKDDKISNYFQIADYAPTKGSTYGSTYKLVHPEGYVSSTDDDPVPFLNDYTFAQMVERNNGKPVSVLAQSLESKGENKAVRLPPAIFNGMERTIIGYPINNVTGADYTIGLGNDSKGPYISYYDEYDLNAGILGKHKTGDIDMSISHPFSIYDRKYYSKEDSAKIMDAYHSFGHHAFDRKGKLINE